MDRLVWSTVALHDHEDFLHTTKDVKIYDGDEKSTPYVNGSLVLTSHRLIWADSVDQKNCISLNLRQITSIEEEVGSIFSRSSKVVCHLEPVQSSSARGPVGQSRYSHVKLSFKDGQIEFTRQLKNAHGRKLWEQKATQTTAGDSRKVQPAARMTGIAGIERKMQEKQRHTDKEISVAFEDLDNLIAKAKEMVSLSQSIASKIEKKQGAITDDETIQFKSYLLSLGIPDPVTRASHKSASAYLKELAKQISSALLVPLEETGGIMTLTDVYCRINRARGMELLSPQDLLDAAKLFESLTLPVRLRTYDSGVKVIQLVSKSEESLISDTNDLVTQKESMTADELANLIGLSVILAKERLWLAEQKGKLCRDDTVEGLRFYPNKFLTDGT